MKRAVKVFAKVNVAYITNIIFRAVERINVIIRCIGFRSSFIPFASLNLLTLLSRLPPFFILSILELFTVGGVQQHRGILRPKPETSCTTYRLKVGSEQRVNGERPIWNARNIVSLVYALLAYELQSRKAKLRGAFPVNGSKNRYFFFIIIRLHMHSEIRM